jgi:hypothetical protein
VKSNFDFLQGEWPDFCDAASKVESLTRTDALVVASTRGARSNSQLIGCMSTTQV